MIFGNSKNKPRTTVKPSLSIVVTVKGSCLFIMATTPGPGCKVTGGSNHLSKMARSLDDHYRKVSLYNRTLNKWLGT